MPAGLHVMKSLQIAGVVTAAIFALLVALVAGGILTPRGFGVAGFATMALCGFIWYRAWKAYSSVNTGISERQDSTWRAKEVYLRLAPYLIVLAFALWATRGGPWLPRLIGVTMWLLFFVGALRYRR
jgi:hypothetical protein